MKPFIILALSLLLAGCSTRPVFISDVDYPPLAKGTPVQVTFAADQPAPASKRFAFSIRQIGVGSQSDLNGAIESGTN
jgi:hypothetical protein